MPDKVPGAHHGLLGGAVVFFGVDPRTGRRFVVQSIEGGGWGGRPTEDGESGTVSVCQGDVRNGSIEGIELKCPVLVKGRALRPDSAGAGKFRGGLGNRKEYELLGDATVTLRLGHQFDYGGWGVFGGKEPAKVRAFLNPRTNHERALRPLETIRMTPGESFLVEMPGGGGYGDPHRRDRDRVRRDVAEGFVSYERAVADYGLESAGD
jgi:N-methylhydantoinase B